MTTKVNASTRVLAAGIAENKTSVRATVTFMPSGAKGQDGIADVDIEAWPRDIEALLSSPKTGNPGLRYFAAAIPRDLSERPAAPTTCRPVPVGNASPKSLDAHISEITTLWTVVCNDMASAMTNDSNFWTEFRGLFEQSKKAEDSYYRTTADGGAAPNVLPTGASRHRDPACAVAGTPRGEDDDGGRHQAGSWQDNGDRERPRLARRISQGGR